MSVSSQNKAKRRRLMSNLMADQDSSPSSRSAAATTTTTSNESSFLVRSNNSDFSGRQNVIFDQLDSLAKQYDRDVIARHDPPPPEPELEEDIRAHDVFVVPTRRPPPRRRFPTRCSDDLSPNNHYKPPDFRIHPEKWTRYSLDDVTEDQMTDKSNSEAAFEFLARNKFKGPSSAEEDLEEVVRFNRPFGRRKATDDKNLDNPRSSTSSGKWVMPEYVVGQKTQPIAPRRVTPAKDSASSSTVPLAHLEVVDGDVSEMALEKTKNDDAFKAPKRNFRKGNLRGRSADTDV